MSKHRPIRMTRVDAERLFDAGFGAPEPLAALLAAVTPSPASGEVAGERAALAEFRAAHLTTVASRRRRTMLKAVLANLAAAKVALAATAAAAATGGIVVVAATGHLPGAARHGNHDQRHGAALRTSTSSVATRKSASKSTSKLAPEPSRSAAGRPSGISSPWLPSLCRAYLADAIDNPGNALDNPAFSMLVPAAHGKDEVTGYCMRLVGPARSHPRDARPADQRQGWQTDHHHGWPTSASSGWPTDPSQSWSTHPNPPAPTHPGDDRRTRSTGPTHPQPSGPPSSDAGTPPASPGQP